MCYPALIGLAGAGVGAMDQIEQGNLSEAEARRDAEIGALQAKDALSRGGVEEANYRRQLRQIVGAARADIGARNVAGGSGTALDLLSDTAMIGEEDAQTIRNEAAREAWGYRVGADESRRWGANARRNSRAAAGGTLLTGAAQAWANWGS